MKPFIGSRNCSSVIAFSFFMISIGLQGRCCCASAVDSIFNVANISNVAAAAATSTVRLCPEDNGNTDRSGFSMCLALDVDPQDEDLFVESAELWSSKIIGDVPDINVPPTFTSNCGRYPDVLDDLFICGRYADIDGPGGILGSAGLQFVRDSGLPASGEMSFDAADVEILRRDGILPDVIEHEMGHLVGIGPLWARNGATGGGFFCPYTGVNANREWQALSGCRSGRVPTEKTGGSGTRCGHWDEDCLQNEIMTGYLNGVPGKFSALTIATLEDIGYEVPNDYSTVTDIFTSDDISPRCRCGRGLEMDHDVDEEPEPPVHRKLSEDGKKRARTWGKAILRQQKVANARLGNLPGLQYFGDQFIDVLFMEDDHVFSVGVWFDDV